MKKILLAVAVILLIALGAFFFVVPAWVESDMNAVLHPPPYQASERARELHQKLLIADLHADSLLWSRDLLERGGRGHVDVPRLIEGNVALQAFTVVTKTPRDMNIESNTGDTDNITLLAIAQRWPFASWGSLKERALHQSRKLHEFAARSGGKLTLIKTAADLSNYLARRRQEQGITAGFLGIEGAHALDGDLNNIDVLFDAGFRMMAPTHFFDNDLGGSAHGVEKGGLTDKGREMIRRMEARRMIVDLAHASAKVIEDTLAIATRPVVVSHTGVKGTCDNNRNLSDEQIKAIAKNGGVIGIGYWDTAVCGQDARSIARAIRHVVNLVGAQHVGLGSDYDGAIPAPFDTTGLAQITDALLAEGFTEPEIKMIMGGNVLRLLRENLP
ncbi:MAG TPA: dipeptidase [Blastocatellia bacterium]|nr:dipeptidase [Blastocatellia bacterium]